MCLQTIPCVYYESVCTQPYLLWQLLWHNIHTCWIINLAPPKCLYCHGEVRKQVAGENTSQIL